MDHGNDNRVDQVLAIILLAYAIAWPDMFLADFIFPGNPIVEGLAGPFIFTRKAFDNQFSLILTRLARSPDKTYAWMHGWHDHLWRK